MHHDAGDIYATGMSGHIGQGTAIGGDYFEGDALDLDMTGFRTARSLARLVLIVGTIVTLVGFGLLGYMLLDALGSMEIAFVPWGVAGAAAIFAGAVIYSIGMMMNRSTDRREERLRRRKRR